MPISEYACFQCKTIIQFWSPCFSPYRHPQCPQCQSKDMEKLMSSFALDKNQSYSLQDEMSCTPSQPLSNKHKTQFEHRSERVTSQPYEMVQYTPQQLGSFLRNLSETTGMKLGTQWETVIRQLEHGIFPSLFIDEEEYPFGESEDETSSLAWSYDTIVYEYNHFLLKPHDE